ncbi:hypothetical protein GEV43_20965 [Actinomadura sp. J1-007]|uniref:hypothetical protein n=1 Tax=Actinomadura sp. J1-007 TaxID=2661913 RepID=UPI00132C4F73|nr:hypothetical protein [Actinomadura sp. J1-007]MWK36268.1 hypothetical protein [Actinomadura sp. J1-007]
MQAEQRRERGGREAERQHPTAGDDERSGPGGTAPYGMGPSTTVPGPGSAGSGASLRRAPGDQAKPSAPPTIPSSIPTRNPPKLDVRNDASDSSTARMP